MKNTKKIVTLTLALVLVLAFTGIANASSIVIYADSSTIINNGGDQVRIYSSTQTNIPATKIKHYMVLQRYNGGWETYSTSTYYRYDSSNFYSSTYKSVSPGYTYRLIAYHTAYDGIFIVDYKISVSSSIYMS